MNIKVFIYRSTHFVSEISIHGAIRVQCGGECTKDPKMTTPKKDPKLVKDLVDVVQAQQKAQKEALEESSKQINNLANSVKIIAETKQHGPFGLKLPQINLPKYHGRLEEDLERFVEQLRSTKHPFALLGYLP